MRGCWVFQARARGGGWISVAKERQRKEGETTDKGDCLGTSQAAAIIKTDLLRHGAGAAVTCAQRNEAKKPRLKSKDGLWVAGEGNPSRVGSKREKKKAAASAAS